ncbi:MAG: response regulator receiver [Verrucomicrobiales bacterium]|nr:response regulator receiver [Verrucomicrobiales bacterium]
MTAAVGSGFLKRDDNLSVSDLLTRILLVDDEPELGEMMRITLERAGYEVYLATNAAEAFGAFRSRVFDLAILDEMMPGSKGHELAACLKGYEPSFPIILASAFPQKAFPGVDHILLKPVAPEILRNLIVRILPGYSEAA